MPLDLDALRGAKRRPAEESKRLLAAVKARMQERVAAKLRDLKDSRR